MKVLKKATIFMLALACMPFSGCVGGTDSSSSKNNGTSFDKELPMLEKLRGQTFTYQGEDYLTEALVREGEKYFKVDMTTGLSSYRITGKFDELIGRSEYYRYVYTMSADAEENFLYELYYRDVSLVEGGSYAEIKMTTRGLFLKEGAELPDVFESVLRHVEVTKETLVGRTMQVETLLDVDFEKPTCLGDILSLEECVIEIDTRLDVYATFDLADYTWLQLGELAIYKKDGALYLRPNAWKAEYYKLKDEYQEAYKDMLA